MALFLSWASSALASPSLKGLVVAPSAKSVRNGSFFFARVHVPDGLDAAKLELRFAGVLIPLYPVPAAGPREFEGLVPVSREQKPGRLDLKLTSAETPGEKTVPVRVRAGKYGIEHIKVSAKYVEPPEAEVKRIQSEQQEVGALYARILREKLWTGAFRNPAEGPLGSPFGIRRTYNGQPRSSHPGTDFKVKAGTPVLAPAPARVALAKDLYFTGNTVILDHGYGLFTLYAHLSTLEVKAGDRVTAQQRLGLSGATGRASGPHLHWGAVIHGVKVDPVDLTRLLH